jgi:glutaredoxin
MKTVTIYTTPTCHFCHLAKDYFTDNDIAFTEYNVATDLEKRQEMVDLTGQMGVPVISVQAEGQEPQFMVGFSEKLFADTFAAE